MSGLRSLASRSRAGRQIGDRPQVLHSRAGPPGSPLPNNIAVCSVAGATPYTLVIARRLSEGTLIGVDPRRSYEERVHVSGT